MVEDIPTFESMFRKSKGLDLAEEAPFEGEPTSKEIQSIRVGDKLTDGDGNSRLRHKANVAALENYNPDINAPQGEVHDAEKLKAPKPKASKTKSFRESAGFREMLARECFEKTGRIPDIEFIDSYSFEKRLYPGPTAYGYEEPMLSYKELKMKEDLMNRAQNRKHEIEQEKADMLKPRLKRVYVGEGPSEGEDYGTRVPDDEDDDEEFMEEYESD